jgi:hypothetical protein
MPTLMSDVARRHAALLQLLRIAAHPLGGSRQARRGANEHRQVPRRGEQARGGVR